MKRLTEAHLQKLEALKKERFLLECVEKLDRLAIKDAFPAKREDYYAFAEHIYKIAMKHDLKSKQAIFTLMLAWHIKGDAIIQDQGFMQVLNHPSLTSAQKKEYFEKFIFDTIPQEEEA